MLVEVVSHFEGDAPLITATHVCHLWRMTLLSSPRLWSHLDFANKERALVYSERSKSVPVSVDITGVKYPLESVRESLKKIAARVTMLWAAHGSFLDELLAHPMPMLEVLEITDSGEPPSETPTDLPSLAALVIYGFDPLRFHAPLLTSFHLTYGSTDDSLGWKASTLLDFLRSCPLLEVASFSCDVDPDSDEVVSLPFLRSFTHESPFDDYQLHLFDRLSLPSTCQVVLAADVTAHGSNPWIPGLPTPRDPSYLSDIKTVKIAARSHIPDADGGYAMFQVELVNSTHKAISFDRISYHGEHPSLFSHQGFSDIFGSVETGSIETLCFTNYPVHTPYGLTQVTAEHITQGLRKFQNLKTLILVGGSIKLCLNGLSSCPTVETLAFSSMHFATEVGVVNRLEEFVASRKKAGTPLRVLTLIFPFVNLHPSELGRLRSCVGRVEFLGGGDAFCWKVDEYLLGAVTHKDNSAGL